MRFGTVVRVRRGGSPPPGTPGCTRWVKGVLVGARGHERFVKLLEDDPLDSLGDRGWSKKGDVGHWSAQCVIPWEDDLV